MLERTTFLYEYLKLKGYTKEAFKYIVSLKLSKSAINGLMQMIMKSENANYMALTVVNYEDAPKLLFINHLIMDNNMEGIMTFIGIVGEIDNKIDRYLKSKNLSYEKGSCKLPSDIPVSCFIDITKLNHITEEIFTDFLYDNGLIETINALKISNSKSEILNFLTKSPNNLELLQIYLPYFTSDLSEEEQEALDLEFFEHFSSKKQNKIIYKVKQEGRHNFSVVKQGE